MQARHPCYPCGSGSILQVSLTDGCNSASCGGMLLALLQLGLACWLRVWLRHCIRASPCRMALLLGIVATAMGCVPHPLYQPKVMTSACVM